MTKKIINLKIILGILVLTTNVYASSPSICENIQYIESTNEERKLLLNHTLKTLISGAKESVDNLTTVKIFLTQCQSYECDNYQAEFKKVLLQQIYVSKLIKAILKKSSVSIIHRTRSPLNLKQVLQMISDRSLKPQNIAQFELEGFSFDHKDKQDALKLWTNVFVRMVNTAPKKSLKHIVGLTNKYFKQLSYDTIAINPLLGFLNEDQAKDIAEIEKAFEKLIDFNQDFLKQVSGMQTDHKSTFWSYINITLPDHEMGLVNFPTVIANVIKSNGDTNSKIKTLCSAWKDLQTQQKIRIRASIGVGFATAVVCGVGIWSGVGTLPAAALCSFAAADGLWGARRGYLDAKIAQSSLYAGVKLYANGEFGQGFLSPESSARNHTQGKIVFMINILGLIPIGRAVATTVKNVRGSSLDLFTIPSADLTVSTIESGSANLAYATLVLRGSEALQNEFQDEIYRMNAVALALD